MDIQTDGHGQSYIDVENVRITLVIRDGTGWDGPGRYLRIQGYKDGSASLNLGPELPITKANASPLAFISAVAQLVSLE